MNTPRGGNTRRGAMPSLAAPKIEGVRMFGGCVRDESGYDALCLYSSEVFRPYANVLNGDMD